MKISSFGIGFILWPMIGFFISMSQPANALPLPRMSEARASAHAPVDPGYNYEGIVALDNCSGSLIRFEASKETDPAIVLTNGHCVESGPPAADVVISHQASSRTFNLMNSTGETAGELQATEIIYASMKKTDITLYQVKQTYADITSRLGVRPFTLSSGHPQVAQNIFVVSGYWHRGYSCSVEAFIPELREDQWTWKDSIRYSRPGCEVIGGTSGSPIILQGSRTVIGINNTTNESGEQCTFDNPCEVDASGQVSFQQGYSYGQETYWIYSCLNEKSVFDLTLPSCQLAH